MRKRFFLFLLTVALIACGILPATAANPVPVESMTLEASSATIAVGETIRVKAVVSPQNATEKKTEWSSSDESIATVKNGTVKGIAPGTAIITASAADGSGVSASMEVTVVQPVQKISTPDAKLVLAPGTGWKPKIVIEPANATNPELRWTSSNEKIAAVDESGNISAIAAGKCSIVGSSVDGSGKKVTISLQVKNHDVVILTPEEVAVSFETRGAFSGSKIQVGNTVREKGEHVYVEFIGGLVCEGSGQGKLRPLKPGSGSVVVTRQTTGGQKTRKPYTVFVAQEAAHLEDDEEIGRLAAENFEGHTYQVFYSSRAWDDAKEFCEKHHGHLVTITSEEEQRFLEDYLSKAANQKSYWIGLDSGKNKDFSKWITGEKISYTNWMGNNPDGNEPFHNCARIAASEFTDEHNWTMKRGTWDDIISAYGDIAGFICEWDEGSEAPWNR